jgi:hypothetical protein
VQNQPWSNGTFFALPIRNRRQTIVIPAADSLEGDQYLQALSQNPSRRSTESRSSVTRITES